MAYASEVHRILSKFKNSKGAIEFFSKVMLPKETTELEVPEVIVFWEDDSEEAKKANLKAIEILEEFVKKNPDHPKKIDTLERIALICAYTVVKDYDKGINIFEKLLEENPEYWNREYWERNIRDIKEMKRGEKDA